MQLKRGHSIDFLKLIFLDLGQIKYLRNLEID
jgi:hypothetical protein